MENGELFHEPQEPVGISLKAFPVFSQGTDSCTWWRNEGSCLSVAAGTGLHLV